MYHIRIAGLIILMIFVHLAIAQHLPELTEQISTNVNLDALIQEALQHNPQIKSAEQQWVSASQRVAQVSSLDDPMFTYTHWFSSVETRVGPMQNAFMLSQEFPFFGKLHLRGEMVKQDIEVATQSYEATRREVIYKVKFAYYDLYWIDKSLAVLDEYQMLLQRFQQVASRKYATGAGIQANVLKARLEISSIEERRLNFVKMREGVVARLNALLGREKDMSIDAVTAIDSSFYIASEQELIQKAAAFRQELKAIEAIADKSELAIKLAQKNYWPDITLSASYITIPGGRTFALDAGKDSWSIQVEINVPIWRGKYKAARTAHHMHHRNLKNEVIAEVRDVFARLKAAEQTVGLYRDNLIPDAERTLRSALSSYQTGTLDFLSLLDSERMLLQFRLAYVKELAHYRQQVAALERAVGGELT